MESVTLQLPRFVLSDPLSDVLRFLCKKKKKEEEEKKKKVKKKEKKKRKGKKERGGDKRLSVKQTMVVTAPWCFTIVHLFRTPLPRFWRKKL